ncbi:hypothetical protein GCM10020229_10840 [Kitasatospora albolonga]
METGDARAGERSEAVRAGAETGARAGLSWSVLRYDGERTRRASLLAEAATRGRPGAEVVARRCVKLLASPQ